MAGYMLAELWCDECGFRVLAEDTCTLREYRADMRENGWCRKRHPNSGALIDLCPSCLTPSSAKPTEEADHG